MHWWKSITLNVFASVNHKAPLLTLTVSSVIFLSILVAAYWLSRCKNTCRRGKQQLTRLKWPQDSISYSHPIACTSKQPDFKALCAAATLPLYLKLATLTMETWDSQNIIFVLEKGQQSLQVLCYKSGSSWLWMWAVEANSVWTETDGKCSYFLRPEDAGSHNASPHKALTFYLMLHNPFLE